MTVADDTILEVKNLKQYFPVNGKKNLFVKAVDDVSFKIARGETFGLVGESGCGKTTTGRCVLGMYKPTGGEIWFNGQEISHYTRAQRKPIRRDIQLIFQDPYGSLDPRKSVFSIIAQAVTAGEKKYTPQTLEERVRELMQLVGLNYDLHDRFPHEMSGGQRQRVGIARALACEPQLIVCDEPVSALDVSIQAQIVNLFEDLQKRRNLTYIFLAPDLAVVRHISRNIAVMYLGHIMELTDSETLYRHCLHPYTRALLSAIPIADYYVEQSRERIILQGEIPSPINPPSGCPFHPRCANCIERCRQEMPELVEVEPGHKLACFNPNT